MPRDPTSREYRDSVGMFTTGITVVTATSERFGHGMTANAFASVSSTCCWCSSAWSRTP